MSDKIKQRLQQLEELYAQQELINIHKQAAIDKILPPELKAELAAIDLEFGQQTEAVKDTINTIESEVKLAVVAHGTTVKGQRFMAVYNKARVSWDTKGLDGYAAAHPEIERFRKEGEPSVSIRKS
jgi:hypothetical protein